MKLQESSVPLRLDYVVFKNFLRCPAVLYTLETENIL